MRSIWLAALGARHQAARLAILARAVFAQELPGIDAMLVPVVPGEADAVLTDRLDFRRTRQRFEDRQRPCDRFQRIARLAAVFLALFDAECAGTRIAQKHEAVGAAMAILPFDVHAAARSLVDFDRLGIGDEFHESGLSREPTL